MANCVILSGGTWSPATWPKFKRTLGPYRLTTALEEAGYSTFVLDFIEEFSREEIAEILSKHVNSETLWFGFSSSFFWNPHVNYTDPKVPSRDLDLMYYDNYSNIQYVVNFVKFISPNVKIIYGGSKAPYYSEQDIDKNIDYYVTGNADNSIIDVTDFLAGKTSEIKHLSGKQVDSFKYPEPDLLKIKTDWSKQAVVAGEGLPLELARGCIFKCKFCDYPLTGKKKGTYIRDVNQVKEEMIKNWEVHGTDTYFFTDDTFNDDNDKLESLHKIFTELPFKLKFSSFLRLDLMNKFPHQAQLLLEMGLVGNFFGLESMNQKSATAIGKGLRINKVKDRLYWLKEQWGNKVNIEAGFILGLPYDTEEYFEELISWCMEKDNPIDAPLFYPLMLFQYKESKELQRYVSEFALNPEIYGYKITDNNLWELPSQNLSYQTCLQYSNKFNAMRSSLNKISGFFVITSLNTGVSLEDIRTLTQKQIELKYDIPSLNKAKVKEYKRLIK